MMLGRKPQAVPPPEVRLARNRLQGVGQRDPHIWRISRITDTCLEVLFTVPGAPAKGGRVARTGLIFESGDVEVQEGWPA